MILAWFLGVPLLLIALVALAYALPLPAGARTSLANALVVAGALVYLGGLAWLICRWHRAPMVEVQELLEAQGWQLQETAGVVQRYRRVLPQQVQGLRVAFDHRNHHLRLTLEVRSGHSPFQVESAPQIDHAGYLAALARLRDASHGADATLDGVEGRPRWNGRVSGLDAARWRALSADFDRIAGLPPP